MGLRYNTARRRNFRYQSTNTKFKIYIRESNWNLLNALKDVRILVKQIKLNQTQTRSPIQPVNILQIVNDLYVPIFVVVQVHRVSSGAVEGQHRPDGRGVQIVHRPEWWTLVHRLSVLRSRGICSIAGVKVTDEGVVYVAAFLAHTYLPETWRSQEKVFIEKDAALYKNLTPYLDLIAKYSMLST